MSRAALKNFNFYTPWQRSTLESQLGMKHVAKIHNFLEVISASSSCEPVLKGTGSSHQPSLSGARETKIMERNNAWPLPSLCNKAFSLLPAECTHKLMIKTLSLRYFETNKKWWLCQAKYLQGGFVVGGIKGQIKEAFIYKPLLFFNPLGAAII